MFDDLVKRQFRADAPNRLWLTDIAEHWTSEGKLYCSAIKDVFSNKIVGYSIADRMTAKLADELSECGDGERLVAVANRRPKLATLDQSKRAAENVLIRRLGSCCTCLGRLSWMVTLLAGLLVVC